MFNVLRQHDHHMEDDLYYTPHPICKSAMQNTPWVEVCTNCKGYLTRKKPSLPPYSLTNGLTLDEIPACLSNLTWAEKRCVSKYNSYIHVCHIGGFQQFARSGGEMNIATDVPAVIEWAKIGAVSYIQHETVRKADTLPRSPHECDIINIRSKGLGKCVYKYEVSRTKIREALNWLVNNHPSYFEYRNENVPLVGGEEGDVECLFDDDNMSEWEDPEVELIEVEDCAHDSEPVSGIGRVFLHQQQSESVPKSMYGSLFSSSHATPGTPSSRVRSETEKSVLGFSSPRTVTSNQSTPPKDISPLSVTGSPGNPIETQKNFTNFFLQAPNNDT